MRFISQGELYGSMRYNFRLASITDELCKFLDDYFRSAIQVSVGCIDDSSLLISSEGLATLLKSLLNSIFPKSTVKLRINTDGGKFSISLEAESDIRLSCSEMALFKNLACSSGFSLEITESLGICKAEMSARTRSSDALKIYAAKEREIYNIFKRVFFGI